MRSVEYLLRFIYGVEALLGAEVYGTLQRIIHRGAMVSFAKVIEQWNLYERWITCEVLPSTFLRVVCWFK